MLTKKRLVFIAAVVAAFYFVIFMILFYIHAGDRADNVFIYMVKVGFLSVSASIATAVLMVFCFKREFIKWQLYSFGRFKHLLMILVKRDFISRYRKSVLGVLWSLLNPLLTMAVITMVFSYLFRFEIPNFPVYLLSGMLIFGFFNESTTQSLNSVIASEGIIKKVYVPKYIFPVAKVLSSLVNFAFSLIALIIVIIITRAPIHWTMLLVPIPIFYTFVFSLGVAMVLSSMSVFFRDLTYLYGVFITLLTYLTPLFYPIDILPYWLQPIIGINPMFQLVSYFRSLVLYGAVPDLWTNIVCISLALTSLCVGTYVFMSKQEKFILFM